MKVLIVESPGKVKKIQGFLGPQFKVMASVGHVRDLPLKEIGVEPPDFKPHYVPTDNGKNVLKKLAEAVKGADTVYLATDPDREGEAIAWHLEDDPTFQKRPSRESVIGRWLGAISFVAYLPAAIPATVLAIDDGIFPLKVLAVPTTKLKARPGRAPVL